MTQPQLLEFAKTGRVWLRQAIPQEELRTLRAAGAKNGRIGADHPVLGRDQGWLDQVRSL